MTDVELVNLIRKIAVDAVQANSKPMSIQTGIYSGGEVELDQQLKVTPTMPAKFDFHDCHIKGIIDIVEEKEFQVEGELTPTDSELEIEVEGEMEEQGDGQDPSQGGGQGGLFPGGQSQGGTGQGGTGQGDSGGGGPKQFKGTLKLKTKPIPVKGKLNVKLYDIPVDDIFQVKVILNDNDKVKVVKHDGISKYYVVDKL